MSVIAIDKAGDVLLELTKAGAPDCDTLQVSSKVLTLVSPVFAAMFNGRFRESQRNLDGSFAPVKLLDDDPAAMTLLCNILHFKSADLPEVPDLELFAALAVVGDKYDCFKAIAFVSENWLRKQEALVSTEKLDILLYLAYVFDEAGCFARISARVAKEFKGNLELHKGLKDLVTRELLSM